MKQNCEAADDPIDSVLKYILVMVLATQYPMVPYKMHFVCQYPSIHWLFIKTVLNCLGHPPELIDV